MAVGGSSGGGGGKSGDVRAGGAFVEVSAKDSLTTALTRINARVQKFASGMKAVGAKISLFGAAGLAPLTALFKSGVDRAEGIGKNAEQLGFMTDQFQRLQYAADVAGVSVEDVMKMPGRYSKLMDEASLLDPQTIKDSTAANQEFRKTWIELQNAITPLVSALAPTIKSVNEFIRENAGLVRVAALASAAVVGIGAAVVVAGSAIGGASVTFAALVSTATTLFAVGSAMLTPMFWGVAAAIAGATVAFGATVALFHGAIKSFLTMTDIGRTMGSAVSEAFSMIFSVGSQAISGIIKALADGDFSKAWDITLKVLNASWKAFSLGVTQTWVGVKNSVVDIWKDMIAEIQKLWSDANAWILRNDPTGRLSGHKSDAQINADRDAEKGQIDTERNLQKKNDRDFRNLQVQNARDELNKAKADLNALTNTSKADKPKRPEDYLYFAGAAQRGAFRITGDSRQFGEGKNSELVKLQSKQVGLLEGILGENKDLNKNLRIS